MSARVLIRYFGPLAPMSWCAEDERGRMLYGPAHGHAPPSTALEGAREIVVFVPAEQVLLLEAAVPAKQREQMLRALPYALEEQVAESVEAMHFAPAPASAGVSQLVACVRRETFKHWLDDLTARGVQPDTVVPEQAALRVSSDQGSVLIDGARSIVRLDRGRAFVAETRELAQWLTLADAPRDADGRLRLAVHCDDIDSAQFLGLGIAALPAQDEGHPLQVLARGSRGAALPNLLSGSFAPRHRGESTRQLWRVAAMLLIGLTTLGFAYLIADRWQLAGRLTALDNEMQAVYREVYPDGRATGDPYARMDADYRQAQGGRSLGGPLALLAKVAPVLTLDTQNVLKALEYRNGTLEITLLAPGVAALDAVRESAASIAGIQAELASANGGERGAEGRLRISGRAP